MATKLKIPQTQLEERFVTLQNTFHLQSGNHIVYNAWHSPTLLMLMNLEIVLFYLSELLIGYKIGF